MEIIENNPTHAPSSPPSSPSISSSISSSPFSSSSSPKVKRFRNFEEAIQDQILRAVMNKEIKAIEKNDTLKLASLPLGKKIIGIKWVLKEKKNVKRKLRGTRPNWSLKIQLEGWIDYNEIFSHVTHLETIRLITSLAVQNNYQIYQLEVKSAFLNEVLEEEVYVEQPLSYMRKGEELKVLKLKMTLSGLKQAPRVWNSRIDKYFQTNNFSRCHYKIALYTKTNEDGDFLTVCLYVDDLFFTRNNPHMFKEFKNSIIQEFDIIGLISYYHDIKVRQGKDGIFISQEDYTKTILEMLNIKDCNTICTPIDCRDKLSKYNYRCKVDAIYFKNLVGSLCNLTYTRPVILYSIELISKFTEALRSSYLLTTKKIFTTSKVQQGLACFILVLTNLILLHTLIVTEL